MHTVEFHTRRFSRCRTSKDPERRGSTWGDATGTDGPLKAEVELIVGHQQVKPSSQPTELHVWADVQHEEHQQLIRSSVQWNRGKIRFRRDHKDVRWQTRWLCMWRQRTGARRAVQRGQSQRTVSVVSPCPELWGSVCTAGLPSNLIFSSTENLSRALIKCAHRWTFKSLTWRHRSSGASWAVPGCCRRWWWQILPPNPAQNTAWVQMILENYPSLTCPIQTGPWGRCFPHGCLARK